MEREEKWLLLFTLFAVICQLNGADLTPSACKFDTVDHNNKNVFFVLKTNENPTNLESVDFTIGVKKFSLRLTQDLKTYVSYDVPARANSVDCSFVADGVILTYAIEDVAGGEDIQLPRGASVALVFGGKRVQIVHDKPSRDHVPFSVQVIKGADTKSKVSLDANKEAGKEISVDLLEDKQNFVVVAKERIEVEDSFGVVVEMAEDANVVITNLQEDQPSISLASTCSLTCLSALSCPFDIQKQQHALLLSLHVLTNNRYSPALEIAGKVSEVVPLSDGLETVVQMRKEEFGENLKFSFRSDLEDIQKPATISIHNSIKPDWLVMRDKAMEYRGKGIHGVFITGHQDTTFRLYSFDNSPHDRRMFFEIVNPLAINLDDLFKNVTVIPYPNPNTLYLFKEQVNTIGEVRFILEEDQRASIVFTQEPMKGFSMLPGTSGVVRKQRPGLLKQHTKKTVTLILELDEGFPGDSTTFQLGEEEFEVCKMPLYKYLSPEDFKQQEVIFCGPKDDIAILKFKRIEAKVPFKISFGKQVLQGSMDFNIKVQDPTKGATVRIKEANNKGGLIVFNLDLNRKEKNGDVMKVKRGMNGVYEEVIFIYPEDLNGAKELTGSIQFGKGQSVEINILSGIEEMKIESQSYYVRKNSGQLVIRMPFMDNEVRVQLEHVSAADGVLFELGGSQHRVDKNTKIITVPLTKEFLAQHPSPTIHFTSQPSNLDAYVNIRIRHTEQERV